jgi:hypothetical protein
MERVHTSFTKVNLVRNTQDAGETAGQSAEASNAACHVWRLAKTGPKLLAK